MNGDVDSKYIIKSLVKASEILEVLANKEKLSLGELSKITGMGKSTIHRFLNTFKYLSYVEQDPKSGDYFATIKLFELGNKVANRMPIKRITRPYMEELFEKCKETVNLAILDNQDIVYLDKIVAKEPLRIELEIGIKVPFYCSALGKCLAAYNKKMSLENIKFEKYTKKTITTQEKLVGELSNVRKSGFSFDNEEYIKGLCCIAVPIFHQDGSCHASISISLPAARLTEENKEYYISILKETAGKIQWAG